MTTNAICRTELCFNAPNERGTMAGWATELSEYGVNIDAICAWQQDGSTAAFRCITSDNKKAKNYFAKKGYNVTEKTVVCWNAENTPGMIGRVTYDAAEKGINFTGTYAGCNYDNTSFVVFCCDNPTEVENMINTCSTTDGCGCNG
jgi:hypothetical protein